MQVGLQSVSYNKSNVRSLNRLSKYQICMISNKILYIFSLKRTWKRRLQNDVIPASGKGDRRMLYNKHQRKRESVRIAWKEEKSSFTIETIIWANRKTEWAIYTWQWRWRWSMRISLLFLCPSLDFTNRSAAHCAHLLYMPLELCA